MMKILFPLLALIACGTHPAKADPQPEHTPPIEETIENHLKILAEMSANGELAELQQYNPVPNGEIVCIDEGCKFAASDFWDIAWGCFGGAGIATGFLNYDYGKHANGQVAEVFKGSDTVKKIGTKLAMDGKYAKFLRFTGYLNSFGFPPMVTRELIVAFATGGCAFGVSQTVGRLIESQKTCQAKLEEKKTLLKMQEQQLFKDLIFADRLEQCQNLMQGYQQQVDKCQKQLDYYINMTEALRQQCH